MRDYKFYRTSENRWYIDLPEWEGPIDALEMVAGADSLLDVLAENENEVKLTLSLEPFEGCETLEKINDTPEYGGANYLLKKYKEIEFEFFPIWLCSVTEFVFGSLPKLIYFK